jgi:hypothetical protein
LRLGQDAVEQEQPNNTEKNRLERLWSEATKREDWAKGWERLFVTLTF